MSKKEARASDRPVSTEWAKHLRPFGKRKASKRRRKAGVRDIVRQNKDLTA